MALVNVFSPETAREQDELIAVLEARAVPCFVRGDAYASRSYVSQVPRQGTRAILVPAECVEQAVELICEFQGSRPKRPASPRPQPAGNLRSFLGLVPFGRFVSGRGR